MPRLKELSTPDQNGLDISTNKNLSQECERAESSNISKKEKSIDLDKVAIYHLSIYFLPLMIGFSLRSLVYEQYTSWYSWVIGSLTGFVYGFGFILMTPQLYINYKLKSVAHLPWRVLCYRFLNTFIDDLFAFIIRMPTMHRLSCFRDDIIFVLYLYRRFQYPVDKERRDQIE